jgi:hypothetical protein
MTTIDWSAVLSKIADDIKNNRAPPAPLNTGSLADTLAKINAALPAAILTLRAHQGVVTGAADLLAVLSKAGVPYADEIEAAVLSVPGALDEAEKWLPRVVWALTEFQPAPTWQPGPDPFAR